MAASSMHKVACPTSHASACMLPSVPCCTRHDALPWPLQAVAHRELIGPCQPRALAPVRAPVGGVAPEPGDPC